MFDLSSLSALSYANGFTHWHYRTSDSKDIVNSLGYFTSANKMIKSGDMIIINYTNGYQFHSLGFIYEDEGGLTFVAY